MDQVTSSPSGWKLEQAMGIAKVAIICAKCGGPGLAPLSEINRGYGRYCSLVCAHNARVLPLQSRFERLIDRRGPEECWPWLGTKNKRGYGILSHVLHGRKTTTQAHRAYYIFTGRELPADLQLDHLCRNTSCVNPNHLEPVTGRINTLRGNTITAARAAQTHCVNGHPFTGNNLKVRSSQPTHRRCAECSRLNSAKYKATKRQALLEKVAQ